MPKSTTSGTPGKEDNSNDKTDRALLEQLVHGTDTEAARAFTEIDNRHRDSLTQYAVGYCGATEDVAEDCTQNVLLKIWQKRKDLNPETIKLANYLHKAVQNEVRQVQRREKMVEEKDQILMSSASDMPRSTPSADKEYDAKETLSVINRAISNLPKGVRTTFLLRLQKNMSYKEIAAHLGMKPESAERQIMVAVGSGTRPHPSVQLGLPSRCYPSTLYLSKYTPYKLLDIRWSSRYDPSRFSPRYRPAHHALANG